VDVEHTLLTSAGALLRDYAGATSRVEAGRPPAAALQVLKDHVSVDVPRHPGPPPASFARTPPTDDLARSMRARHLATVCLADVPDGPLLGRNAAGVLAAVRQATLGELSRSPLDRLAWIDERQKGERNETHAALLSAVVSRRGRPGLGDPVRYHLYLGARCAE